MLWQIRYSIYFAWKYIDLAKAKSEALVKSFWRNSTLTIGKKQTEFLLEKNGTWACDQLKTND